MDGLCIGLSWAGVPTQWRVSQESFRKFSQTCRQGSLLSSFFLPVNLRQKRRRLVNPCQQLSAFAVGACGFSVPLRPLDIFLARTNNHPHILLLQMMCFIL